VNQTRFNIFEVIGLLADVLDLCNFEMSTLKELNGLFPRHATVGVRTFCFRVELIFLENLTIGLDGGAVLLDIGLIGF
jgi:hypothetical protein